MDRQTISVVIPSSRGRCQRNLDLLVQGVEAQTPPPEEVHVIEGVSPSGRARNMGAQRASGDVLVFLDDDVRLGHERVLDAMVRLLEDPRIGLVGAAQLLPRDSNAFQRVAGRQIPRSCSPVIRAPTDSDMVTTACCAIRRSLFWELGGFNEHIPRGVDPEIRHRIRRRGLRTVVAANAWFYHPMPASLPALCRAFFRNGRQTAEATFRAPWVALENPDGHVISFVARRSRLYRAGRHVGRFFLSLATLRWIGLAAQASYLAGYLWSWARLHRAGAHALDAAETGQARGKAPKT